MFEITLFQDGVRRVYTATSYFDAVVLFDALCRVTCRKVEMWEETDKGPKFRQGFAPHA